MSRIDTVKTEVFKFDELPEEAQNQALSDQITFCLEIMTYEEMSEKMQAACDKAEKMQTPWFTGGYIFDDCKEELIAIIEANEYEFTIDGKMY